jgi:hypothetical protein
MPQTACALTIDKGTMPIPSYSTFWCCCGDYDVCCSLLRFQRHGEVGDLSAARGLFLRACGSAARPDERTAVLNAFLKVSNFGFALFRRALACAVSTELLSFY